MANVELEHANITVSNPQKTAREFCDMFGWKIRWEGEAMNGIGYTVHVGTDASYLALYAPSAGSRENSGSSSYDTIGGLNHIGVLVSDIDAMEDKVKAAGYLAHSHADYEPGKRFYFDNADGIEIEVVSYPR